MYNYMYIHTIEASSYRVATQKYRTGMKYESMKLLHSNEMVKSLTRLPSHKQVTVEEICVRPNSMNKTPSYP